MQNALSVDHFRPRIRGPIVRPYACSAEGTLKTAGTAGLEVVVSGTIEEPVDPSNRVVQEIVIIAPARASQIRMSSADMPQVLRQLICPQVTHVGRAATSKKDNLLRGVVVTDLVPGSPTGKAGRAIVARRAVPPTLHSNPRVGRNGLSYPGYTRRRQYKEKDNAQYPEVFGNRHNDARNLHLPHIETPIGSLRANRIPGAESQRLVSAGDR